MIFNFSNVSSYISDLLFQHIFPESIGDKPRPLMPSRYRSSSNLRELNNQNRTRSRCEASQEAITYTPPEEPLEISENTSISSKLQFIFNNLDIITLKFHFSISNFFSALFQVHKNACLQICGQIWTHTDTLPLARVWA